MAATLLAILALFAVGLALRWKRPDPKHVFTLDMYSRVLGTESETGISEVDSSESRSTRAA
jgi:hypothetical protein